ncbi:hypothetical protein A2U01_0088923, partial [Trifolium medium]|nr:hypothetical protein [Trifolium medium]
SKTLEAKTSESDDFRF